MATIDFEGLQLALPPHLSEADKKKLLGQLEHFPKATGFFGEIDDTEPVQGDAWRGFIAIDFESGQRDQVVGLVISNSCDLAASNNPDRDQNILFAPLVDLSEYVQLLQEIGKSDEYIADRLNLIRRQQVHRIFYLPANGELFGESIILMDDIHAQPLTAVQGLRRLFSLSTYGWYVLLVKLSIHFTRMTDGAPWEVP